MKSIVTWWLCWLSAMAPFCGNAQHSFQSIRGANRFAAGKEEQVMTKADIVEIIYEKVGFSRKESAEIVDLVFDLMKETLESGDKIKISGFGNFVVRQKRSRKGRNPQTGTEIEISARRVLTFKPSQVLRKALNPSG
jgi:integration host factor subunit alpha